MKPVHLLLLSGVLALSACNVIPPAQEDPTRYFVLTDPPALPSVAHAAGEAPFRVGLRNVQIASFLKGPEMIVRRGANELELSEYNRWGESLDAGISRILREELSAAPQVTEVVAQPFPLSTPHDYEVSVDVLHCEGSAGGAEGRAASFEAVVEIFSTGPERQLLARKVFKSQPMEWDGHNFGQLAADLSQDAAELGRQIVSALPAR